MPCRPPDGRHGGKGHHRPFEGSKPRQVLITKERWIEMKMVAAAKAEDNKRNY